MQNLVSTNDTESSSSGLIYYNRDWGLNGNPPLQLITYPHENARCFRRDTLNELFCGTVVSLVESLHERIPAKIVLNILRDIVVCEVL